MDQRIQKINPCLWFDGHGEDAANFYVGIFPNSQMGAITRYGKSGPDPEGSALTVSFTLDGTEFTALNGGPKFKFSEAISFVVNCETQQEIDYFWAKLSEGGYEDQCGWVKDKFGLSWQIVPTAIKQLMTNPDPAKTNKVMTALLKMRKLDIAELERAAES